ncbi:MAG: hypothetical protein O7G85_08330 [Planctomycetota bacterium]|nr:hypothetical protein [Planctomycetota bacterium]
MPEAGDLAEPVGFIFKQEANSPRLARSRIIHPTLRSRLITYAICHQAKCPYADNVPSAEMTKSLPARPSRKPPPLLVA